MEILVLLKNAVKHWEVFCFDNFCCCLYCFDLCELISDIYSDFQISKSSWIWIWRLCISHYTDGLSLSLDLKWWILMVLCQNWRIQRMEGGIYYDFVLGFVEVQRKFVFVVWNRISNWRLFGVCVNSSLRWLLTQAGCSTNSTNNNHSRKHPTKKVNSSW